MESNLLTIRKMEAEDIPLVKKLEEDSNLSPWTIESYRENLNNKDSINLVAIVDSESSEKLVGFIVARLITMDMFVNNGSNPKNQIDIYNIVVDKNYRRKGIGRFLIDECEKLTNPGESLQIWLEVRVSNINGTKFYTNLGFKEKYRRKSFYANPPEDALIMCLEK